jgi:hypothetical protein
MGKGITVDQSEKLLQTCKDLGVKTKVFFSFGHLGETMADVRKTFEFIDQHRSEITTLACGAGVRIYPGTSLEIYARKNSLLPQNFSWSLPYDDERLATIFQTRQVPVLIQPQLGMRELQDIGIRIYGSRFGGWKGFKLGMTKIKDISKLKKLFIFLKLKAKRVIKSL